jgi:hypothetical protein
MINTLAPKNVLKGMLNCKYLPFLSLDLSWIGADVGDTYEDFSPEFFRTTPIQVRIRGLRAGLLLQARPRTTHPQSPHNPKDGKEEKKRYNGI